MSQPHACRFCGSKLPADRPYDHCTAQRCVDMWLSERRSRMSIELIPKQGETYVFTDQHDPTSSGRSSGR